MSIMEQTRATRADLEQDFVNDRGRRAAQVAIDKAMAAGKSHHEAFAEQQARLLQGRKLRDAALQSEAPDRLNEAIIVARQQAVAADRAAAARVRPAFDALSKESSAALETVLSHAVTALAERADLEACARRCGVTLPRLTLEGLPDLGLAEWQQRRRIAERPPEDD